VVKAARGVDGRRNTCLCQNLTDAGGKLWAARRRVADAVSLFRETVVIVEHRRIFRAEQRRLLFLPMRADDENRFGFDEPGGQRGHEPDHREVTRIAQNGQRTAAVAEINGVKGLLRYHRILFLVWFCGV